MRPTIFPKGFLFPVLAAGLTLFSMDARAEIDGHGPDAWRVTGVSSNDHLNARMGPGTNYAVIDSFAYNERGMQQVTCVPFYTAASYSRMSAAQIAALPQRWCLMRNSALSKAGWVAQRFITPDDAQPAAWSQDDKALPVATTVSGGVSAGSPHEPYLPDPDIDPIGQGIDLVRELYERQYQSENSSLPSAFDPSVSRNYFTKDIIDWLASGRVGAHPLYGAQDFKGTISEPFAAYDTPMARGMIAIQVDFTNFGKDQKVVFFIRPDTTIAGSPLRIFFVEHEGWSYP